MTIFRIAFLAVLIGPASSQAQSTPPLSLQQTIHLPGVQGKFDHFAIDEANHRLFAAATGHSSVEVIDLATQTTLQSLGGLGKPHGLAWIASEGRLFAADGSKAELDVFEGSPLKRTKTIKLSDDADDMVDDPSTGLLYVGHGGGSAANPARIAVVDTRSVELIAQLPVNAHPEALEIDPVRDRIFANISDTGQIVVIDGKTHAITKTWSLPSAKGNTPLAYDADQDRLLVGCRTPAKLLVLDGETGKEVASGSSDPGADDLFYEAMTHRAYLVTGSGAVDSFEVNADGTLKTLPPTRTASGAKTGLLLPSQGALIVGIPGNGGDAEIRVYKTIAESRIH